MGVERLKRRLWGPDFRRNADDQYTHDLFECAPKLSTTNGYGDPTGATGDTNLMRTDKNAFEYHIKGAGQTILGPTFDANGYDVSLDQTNDEGIEVTQGITARSKATFVVGTQDCYLKVQFSIADVSGTDDCAVGFRKAEAYQGAIDNYDEMACLNIISGDINIETILNNGATTTTDTTDNWADAATHTLEVYVKNGVVTYKIDGVAPTTTAAFSFDTSEVIIPFFYFLHAADIAGAVALKKWECGLL